MKILVIGDALLFILMHHMAGPHNLANGKPNATTI